MENFCGSPFWDSNITWYTDNPKFTPCFEQTILIWIPCAFLWIFAPVEITYIFKSQNRYIPWNFYNITKVFVNVLLILISGTELSYAIYKKMQHDIPLVEFFTPSIKLVSFFLVLIVSQHNKYYGRRSSGLLFIFWFLLTICSLSQLRTEIEKKISENYDMLQFISYMIFFPLVVLKFLLNCFADKPPLISSNAEQERPCPEYECSFLSRIFYCWFDPLVRTGFKRPLKDDDLWSLNKEHTSAEITLIFEHHWNRSLNKNENLPSTFEYSRINETNVKKKASILPALFKTLWFGLLFSAILELLQVAISFSAPFFLSKLISFISNGEQGWKGYVYAVLLFISVTFKSFVISQYSQQVRSLGMGICTALISAIYKKSLKLSSNARKDAAIGEIVNLMSVDVQKFKEMSRFINSIWSAPLQICLALYFLWDILGASVFSGLGVIVLLLPLNALLVRAYEKSQSAQMENKDQRLKLMNEILSGIKVLKLYAWEPSFEAQITKIRNEEMKAVKKITYMNSAFSFIWLCVPFLVSLVVFATFVLSSSKNILDSKTAFVALSLLNILQFPLTMFPYVINNLIQTYVSTKRINKFMNSDEIDPSNVSLNSSDDGSLKIDAGTFSWGSDDPTLKDINIDVKAKSLVAIVGNVGSGKSSVLSAILGEMDRLSGQVSIHGSIAYVAQQAWIQNETLKNNILFKKTVNENFYDSVVDACALKQDLDMLPAGDQTEIGEKGINLSGGQKQRVSLARAVYFDSDIYLLDDPLSAVDSHVGKHIFDNVIGPKGLLKNKTRILVTNGITYLPQVDHIVVLKEGMISESGTYKELLEKKGSFADFLLQYLSSIKEEENSELLQIKKHLESNLGCDEVNSKLQKLRSMSENESDNVSDKATDTLITPVTALGNDGEKIQIDKIIEEEIAETGNIKWHVYVYYFKILGPFLAIATFLSNMAYQAFSIGTNVWLSKWSTTNDFNSNSTNDTHTRDLYLGVYGALGVGQAFAAYFYNLAPQLGFWLAAKILHEKLLGRILRSPLSFFDTTPTGRILSRFSKDVDVLDETLPWMIAESIFCIFSIFGTIIVISISTPLFIIVVLPVGVVYYFIQRYYIATSRQLRRLESVTRSPIYSHFQETLTGVSTVKAFGLQDIFTFESQEKVDYNNRCKYSSIISNSWLTIRLEIMGNILILFSALFAVITRDKLSPGIVGLSVSYALQITENLSWLVNMVSELESNIVAVERIKEYSENVQEKPWVLPNSDPNIDWPPKGQLDINELVLRYRSSTEPVLHEISCRINAGEKVGVVGRTGAGKSSLALALFRIVEAENGSIFIDGLDISKLGLHTLRSRLTIIPQDPVLFMGSLRFNLDPFDVHTDEEIWSSLEHAHLKSFVENLTNKLEYVIDEAGTNLSVGQRQLICLARALLRKSSILVLDEATAAVDLETDDLIQQTIRIEFSSCTILTIAHRLNTILDSNKILVLDKGKLVEFDSPSNLLHDQNSLFYKLAKDAGVVT